MLEAVAVGAAAAAILGKIGFNITLAPDIVVKYVIDNLADIFEHTAVFDKGLVIGSVVGNIKIVATTTIKLGIHPV